MSDQPSYYAVIPADVRYCKTITANAKLLYGEITALCNKEGYCWATNEHFAELYDVKVLAIKRWIKALEEAGFIHVLLDVTGTRRRICIDEAVSKKIRRGIKNDTGWYPKRYSPRTKKDTHSIKEITLTNNKMSTPIAEADIVAIAAPEPDKSFSSSSQEQKEPDPDPVDPEEYHKARRDMTQAYISGKSKVKSSKADWEALARERMAAAAEKGEGE